MRFRVRSQVIGDITSLFQLFNFSPSGACIALTSVCPNKDELVVQSNKNSKAAVFFAASFFVYIPLTRVTEKTEKSSIDNRRVC